MENTEKIQINKMKRFETEEMPNGEIRWRFKISDKIIFSTTTTHKKYGWQSAHYHIKATEKYLVKKGHIIIAMYKNGKVTLKKLFAGDKLTIQPNTKHNIYINKHTIIYVLKKSPEPLFEDWHYAKTFNIYTRKIVSRIIKLKNTKNCY